MASSSSSTESTADKCIKPMFTKKQEWQNTGTPDGEVMVFYPTKEEFANFSEYIAKIEQMNAHLSSGICKIVPPPDWRPRPSRAPGDYSDVDDFKIECPVRERIEQVNSGCYVKNNTVYRKQMRVADFRRIAESKQYRTPNKDYELLELERYFWRNLLHHEPIYGADTPGSIYDTDVPEFNMSNLGTILDLLKEMKVTIRGVNTVFMYFGMWKTMFPWHAEDMDLYSINYLHFGEPKFWYAIPSQAAEKFERLAAQRFPDGLQICKAFLRHKLYIISPHVLKTHGIPHGTMVQYPGEFIITFPKGYHMGFNLGYNCAESTNFALDRWIDYGKNSLNCFCRKDSVEIDMRPFVKKYRPEEYEKWFEYWYTERPTSYKPKNPDSIENSAGGIVGLTGRRHRRKGSQDTEAVSSEDSLPGMPFGRSICPKRQKKIFHARQPVNDLWANQPPNLFAEKEHNAQCGRLYPHCCVCQYFWARKLWTDSEPVKTMPDRSRRYVTDQMFNKDMLMQDTGWLVSEDDLLECTNCRMVVHRNCYPSGDANRQSTNGYGTVKSGDNGDKQHESMALPCVHQAQAQTSDVKMDNKDLEERKQQKWLCERCLDRDDTLIRTTSCKLCELRGGALVEAQQPNTGNNQNNDFVHVICALIHRPTRFLQPRDRRAPFSPPPRRLIPTSSPWSNHDHNYGNVDGTSPRQQSPRQQMLLLPANGSFSGNQHFSDTVAGAFFNDSGISESSIISTMNLANSSCSSTAENHTKQSPFLADSSKNNNSYSSGSSPSMQSMACRDMMVTMRPTPNSSSNNSPQHQPMEYPACYQCEVCGQQADSEKLIRCDVCLAQDELGAKLRFHVTCAPFADVIFERRNFPECVSAVCSFHNSDQALIDPRRFKLDQRVIVHEEEEGIIGYGSIEEITEHLFATVDFLDGSVSGDIFPIDIRNCECKHFGCNGRSHIPGSLVYVDWHDEKNYEAYYRGKTPKNKFTVKLFPPASFDSKNGEFIEIDSTSIYRKDELELPEAVRQKLFKRKPK